jgi:hypothetical protein
MLVAMGVTTAAASQQPSQQPRSGQPSTQPSQPPRTSSEAVPVARTADDSDPMSFKSVDKNGDGRINRAEAGVIAGFDFSAADTNNDGSLSRPEYQAAKATAAPDDEAAPQTRSRRTAPVSFQTADKNKDGRINRTEASDIPGFDFSDADTNEDASLSRQEFRVALAGWQSRG